MIKPVDIEQQVINSIKMLGVEAVNQAKSGHPGIVLSAAPMVYALYRDHMKFNPSNPTWFNRDRFVLSAGHGSALLYSLLHHAGYDITMEEIKNFRQLNSPTHGHPEFNPYKGIEATTGPLGQGIAMGVGMAMAEAFLAARYNQVENEIVDHYTYVVCGDGDLQEGVALEAVSLAGHLNLNKLIVLYDANDIQLDSPVSLVASTNFKMKIEADNWNHILVSEGEDWRAISSAIKTARNSSKPTLIEIKTIIGAGTTKQGTCSVHGSPLMDDIEVLKKNLEWEGKPFTVTDEVNAAFKTVLNHQGKDLNAEWDQKVREYQGKFPKLYEEIETALKGKIFEYNILQHLDSIQWDSIIDLKPQATRNDSAKILKLLSEKLPILIGGSADLAGSTKAQVYDKDFLPTNHSGRHIHYGVREFGMGAIVNGMTLHQGVVPFGSTFMVFSDYLKPALRMAAIMKAPSLFIFSHDSIAVGEDGPTHEPIEQLEMLRSIPNFNVLRPADTREVIGSYQAALKMKDYPSAIILTRQDLPQLENSDMKKVALGGYIISPESLQTNIDLVIIATGSEVHLGIEVQKLLLASEINTRVISMPSTHLWHEQSQSYKDEILPKNIMRVVIEMGTSNWWYSILDGKGLVFGIDKFGKSGQGEEVIAAYGFKGDVIAQKISQWFIHEKGDKK